MNSMLDGINTSYVSRTNILNALTIALRALEANSDIEAPSIHLLKGLQVGDYEQAIFAFDVLNKMCGDALPTPNIIVGLSGGSGDLASSNGSPLDYNAKVSLAADLINASDKIGHETAQMCGKVVAAAAVRGRGVVSFLMSLPLLYILQVL